ncbi:MAG: GGDEF domain-containing protein [Actinomycetota bacterium]
MLIDEARRFAHSSIDAQVPARLTEALKHAVHPADRGHLLLARALARQGASDPGIAVTDAVEAVRLLQKTDLTSTLGLAMACAAVMLQRTGDTAQAIDFAVSALVIMDDHAATGYEGVRAANALSVIFTQLSAFDLAAKSTAVAMRGARTVGDDTRAAVSFTTVHNAVEAAHAGVALDAELAREAVAWVLKISDPVTRELYGQGMRCELIMVDLGDVADRRPPGDAHTALLDARAELDAGRTHYERAPHRGVTWHRLVRAGVARRVNDLEVASALIEAVLPDLHQDGDGLWITRALRERAAIRAAQGDVAGAYDCALALERRHRSMQVSAGGWLAEQISQRAESERVRSDLRRRAEELTREVEVDPVTGVRTRRWLEARFDQLSADGGSGAVIVLDIDRFKAINDVHGHHLGDQVLGQVGAILADLFRSTDPVARYGGEEFVVVLPETTLVVATDLAELARRGLAEQPWNDLAPGLSVTTSAGVAEGPLRSVRDVMRLADAALYRAKESGRNCVVAA